MASQPKLTRPEVPCQTDGVRGDRTTGAWSSLTLKWSCGRASSRAPVPRCPQPTSCSVPHGLPATTSLDLTKLVSCYRRPPTVLRVDRYRSFFFSNEGYEPPHVHVQDGHKLAKLWLEPVLLDASTGFAPHELTRVRALVAEHREVLLEAWHDFFRS